MASPASYRIEAMMFVIITVMSFAQFGMKNPIFDLILGAGILFMLAFAFITIIMRRADGEKGTYDGIVFALIIINVLAQIAPITLAVLTMINK